MAREQAAGALNGTRQATRWPSVSVIVPTRDRPQTLARAVRSIASQSYPGPIECVIVFDRSEPARVEVELPAGREVRLMTNSRSPGAAGARNTGIVGSDGELVAFCDDDDTWHPDKLRLQVERLGHSAVGFVTCGTRIHYSDRIVARPAPETVDLQGLVRSRHAEMGLPTFLLRRSALADIGLFDEEIPGSYGEDYDLLLRAARRGPILAVPQPLIDVFWHEQSFFAQRWRTIADGLDYLLAKHPELSADARGRARIDGQRAFAHAAMANRKAAWQAGLRAVRGNPLERRPYLALGVAAGLIPASSIIRLANQRGRSI